MKSSCQLPPPCAQEYYLPTRHAMSMPYQLHHLLGTVYDQVCLDFKRTHALNSWFAHLAVLRFEIGFDWKLSLTIPLRLISLAHLTTKQLPFALPQEQNLLAQAIGPGFFLPWNYIKLIVEKFR